MLLCVLPLLIYILPKKEYLLYLKGVYDCVYRYIFNENTTHSIIGEIKFKSLYHSPAQDVVGG